ncbi:hypothetical protein Y032_0056g2703 [Ancylostoma ceylanicum]|uniref:Uncharacterized protein n=1 Tax=Ancylostoma ceylanicum TaxID=53326 RepID=A0A016U5Y3_9BILA|nr:hypothetical protein Y032_0056g2703 [Ancylostoma ceylanicum]
MSLMKRNNNNAPTFNTTNAFSTQSSLKQNRMTPNRLFSKMKTLKISSNLVFTTQPLVFHIETSGRKCNSSHAR